MAIDLTTGFALPKCPDCGSAELTSNYDSATGIFSGFCRDCGYILREETTLLPVRLICQTERGDLYVKVKVYNHVQRRHYWVEHNTPLSILSTAHGGQSPALDTYLALNSSKKIDWNYGT